MATKQDALLALVQQKNNEMQSPSMQPQNPLQGLLQTIAQVAQQTGNPNTERGQIFQGAGNTYLNGLVNQNQNQFAQGVSQIAQSNLAPDQKMNLLISHMANHGVNAADHKDILDAWKAQMESQTKLQGENQMQPRYDAQGNQIGSYPKGSTFASEGQGIGKSFERFSEALDPTKTVRSPLGIAKIAYDKAERLESLAKAYPDGNLDSRQLEELAIGFNSLLQGGAGSGGGSEAIIRNLVPKSAMGNAMKFKEWLTNDPQGTQQQAFVQRMMGTIEREKATTAAQIKRVQFSRIAAFQNLEQKDPEQFNQVLQSYGIDPQEYKSWKQGGYKQVNAGEAGLNQQANVGVPNITPQQKALYQQLRESGLSKEQARQQAGF